MNDLELDPGVGHQTAVKAALREDVTVAMPFYNRIKYFKHYLGEGFWDGFRIQAICDGSPRQVLDSLKLIKAKNADLTICSYPQNKGIAYARSKAMQVVSTPYLVFCDDDDFLIDGHTFLAKACAAMNARENVLFYAMRNVHGFNEELQVNKQYDRCIFHGRSGTELLTYMVRTGEISVLSLGAVFRVQDLRGTEPEPFFKVSEDYVFLARLCARYPNKHVLVDANHGGYLRLTEHDSLSGRRTFSIEKMTMHYVSMFVGAFYLEKMRGITPDGFRHVLRNRSALLQAGYGKGAELGQLLIQLYERKDKSSLDLAHLSDEQRTGLQFLEAHIGQLPAEFCSMVNWEVNAGTVDS